MSAARPGVSERRSCRVLRVSRAGLQRTGAGPTRRRVTDPPWTEQLQQLIQQHPTFGYRRLWVLLRCRDGIRVNRKAVYRVLKQKRWLVHQRSCTPRPRVRGWVSRASRSDERWAMDVTHIPCGQDGWAHLAAVIDCHDREVIGYEFALRSRAKEAERAVEAACLPAVRNAAAWGAPVLRSDNGLIFQSRRFRQACRDYRLSRSSSRPIRRNRMGLSNGSFGVSKKSVSGSTYFRRSRTHDASFGTGSTGTTMGGRISALGYRSPVQYRAQQSTQVA